jgi:type II secretory pathway predicted ATPase ExeA
MEKRGYERYGLSSNPFRDLASESLENVDIFHVVQGIDEELTRIKEEVFYKDNKAVIAILGGLGAGKTERLLLTANEAKQQKSFCLLQNMSMETKFAVEGILERIISETHLSFFKRIFAAPSWYRDVVKKQKKTEKGYDPEKAGRVIAAALNANVPSYLLINDFHHLAQAEDQERFFNVLHVLADHITHGVMVMISCDRTYFDSVMKHHVSLDERINRKIVVPPLHDDEANLMVAKRLLEKRMVDDVDPLYPFTPEAISLLNQQAKGNPRHLLKIADVIIDFAAKKRAIMIDDVLVREILTLRKNQQLDTDIEAEPVLSSVEAPVIVNVTAPKHSSHPTALSINNPLKSGSGINNPSSKKHSRNPVPPVESHQNIVVNKKNDSSNLSKAQPMMKKNLSKRPQGTVSRNPVVKSPSVSSSSSTSDHAAKLRCPICKKIFTTEIDDGTISCPYCDFIGTVKTG